MTIQTLCRPRVARTSIAARLAIATLCVTSLIGLARAQAAGEMKPIAVVTLSSVDHVMEDVNFIGSLAGMPNLTDQIRPQLNGFTLGLDHSRPIGAIIQSDGESPGGAVCLPVTDFKQLLGMMQMFGVTAEEQEDGTVQIGAQGQTLFAREAGGWAFISMMPQMLEGLPDDPGALFAELTDQYDLGVRLNVQNIPEDFRQMAVQQLQAGMESGMNPLPGESDEDFEARKSMTNMQIEQLKRVINEMDEFTLGISVDSEQQRTFLDFVYTAVPGTELAKQVEQNSDPKTDYAGFFQPDAAMMMSFASKVTETDAAQFEQMFGALRKQIEDTIDKESDLPNDKAREVAKSACGDFLDALLETVKAGVMDGGAVLNLAPNSLTMVAGGFVGDPAKVESGLKKLAELAKDEPKFTGVNWNADSHGDVQFHTLSLPIPEDEEEPRQLFGDQIDVAVGIGSKSAFLAFGRDALEAVKGVIDASAAAPQKSVAPMEMTIALKQIMDVAAAFADDDDKDNIQMIADMLGNDATGRDHVRIVVQMIPNGARTRIEAEEGVLRAIGMGVMQSQMEAAGAGQGF